ncbi:hypothetical protein L8106_28521 [Lyngbya sp. PCC 8106]|nr:hypothetical protein L8106_28521 [Lyngbya sp. PCC 8106]
MKYPLKRKRNLGTGKKSINFQVDFPEPLGFVTEHLDIKKSLDFLLVRGCGVQKSQINSTLKE